MKRRRKPGLIFIYTSIFQITVSAFSSQPLATLTSTTRTSTHSSSPPLSTSALMGLKGFRGWFESQFPTALESIVAADSNDTFDHVLVDMNQLLHICVRKSRSDGHGLTLLMKELDAVVDLATPTQSLVLAMDGPPSAAKLATQRRRRFGTVVKAEWKLKNLEKLKKRVRPRLLARKQRRAKAEIRTLRITPGTAFMQKAENCILYWAWQRLSNANSKLSKKQVKIFLSSSTAPGEGEVKLLEWIYSRQRKGSSICILGGDSDLVLEGLVIPPASTHNVFVLLPDGSKRYLAVSLWETTRRLYKYLPHLTVNTIMNVRTDLVLLLILNGNDYLPKLRGSSGFNKLFHAYIRQHREWAAEGRAKEAFMVDPESLEFNIPFTLAFFQSLAALAPSNLLGKSQTKSRGSDDKNYSSLQQLHNLVEGGFLPSPIQFDVIQEDGISGINEVDDDDDEETNMESDGDAETPSDSEDEVEEDTVLVRLLLGDPGTEDFSSYEVWHPRGDSLKTARHELSNMALVDLLGEEFDESDDEEGIPGLTKNGYDWEIRHAVEGKVDAYLYGLVWNLQTYQDGVHADYAFNYGKRLSPTASEIASFFEMEQKNGRKVGLRTLTSKYKSLPISAPVACLAALPSTLKDLVPEPYSRLENEMVESIYAACMNAEDNHFDMNKFVRLCDEEVSKLPPSDQKISETESETEEGGRHIVTNDHSWTVVTRVSKPLLHPPFRPPPPFSDRLSRLRQNNRIRVSSIVTTEGPRPRRCWGDTIPSEDEFPRKSGFVDKIVREIDHSDPGPVLSKNTINSVPFRSVFHSKPNRDSPGGSRRGKSMGSQAISKPRTVPVSKDTVDVSSRLRLFKLSIPPTTFSRTTDGVTAVACLKQLEDAGLVGEMKWESVTPSQSPYATFDPGSHEFIRLTVLPGSDARSTLESPVTAEQDRDIYETSKQSLKHHLAGIAIEQILQRPEVRWTDQTFAELKTLVSGLAQPKPLSVEDSTDN